MSALRAAEPCGVAETIEINDRALSAHMARMSEQGIFLSLDTDPLPAFDEEAFAREIAEAESGALLPIEADTGRDRLSTNDGRGPVAPAPASDTDEGSDESDIAVAAILGLMALGALAVVATVLLAFVVFAAWLFGLIGGAA